MTQLQSGSEPVWFYSFLTTDKEIEGLAEPENLLPLNVRSVV